MTVKRFNASQPLAHVKNGHWVKASDYDALADRLAEVEAQAANDGRPMVTDIFLVKLLDSDLDDHDRVAAIRDWIEGDWVGAMEGIEA